MKARSLLLLGLSLTLSACASLDEGDCRNADWSRMGLNDGLAGKTTWRLDNYRKACAEFGIRPDEARYLAAREQGLSEYCQPENAFRSGLEGMEYQGVCPLDIDLDFRRHNAAALDVYRTRQRIETLEGRLESKERELGNESLSDKDRIALRRELREMDKERERLRDDLRLQQLTLDHLIATLRQHGRWR